WLLRRRSGLLRPGLLLAAPALLGRLRLGCPPRPRLPVSKRQPERTRAAASRPQRRFLWRAAEEKPQFPSMTPCHAGAFDASAGAATHVTRCLLPRRPPA